MRNIFNRNLKIVLSIVTSISFFALTGCDDILEEDITDENIIITAPLSDSTVVGNTVTFQWISNSGSNDYRVQVNDVSNVIVLDSLVSTNSFTYPLSEGEYSWRVRGENFAYQTAYTFPVSFTMEASEVMTNQTVVLNSPSNNFYTNTNVGQLVTWSGIATADSYTLELDREVSGSVSTINQITGVTTTSYTLSNADLSTDAKYIWKIKALNSSTATETNYSIRNILLDTQAPNIPSLSTPVADATESLSTAVVFVWDNGADSGEIQSPVSSVLELATDIGFTTLLQAYTIDTNSQSYTFSTAGDYYWRVKSTDQAGNESTYTTSRKLTIN
jgi:hypothetical protein